MEFTHAIVDVTQRLGRWCAGRPRYEIGLLTLILVLVIGFADYATGTDVTLSVIYAIPILIATWYVSPLYAAALSVLSVVVWICGDAALGVSHRSFLVPVWNTSIRLIFYAFLIVLLARLNSFHRLLEQKVEERAAALTREISERERLERDLLEVSEREQRRIGQDLHDGLCQHLTGTAIASHVLAGKLALRGLAEASDARSIVDHVEEAITLARGTAKGLHPVEMEADGLMHALDEFTATMSEMFGISCRFECDSPVLLHVPAVATNLYRIAQEAVSNAIKHGRAKEVVIFLDNSEQGIKLTISDNGSGIPDPLPASHGMGLRIMADRAKVIGASFSSGRSPAGGAEITCLVFAEKPPLNAMHV